MLERIKYVNSQGEELDFGINGLYVNENDLHDWEWSYDTTYGKIRQFSRKQSTRKLPVKVWADTDSAGAVIKNRLHDVTQVDVIAGTPGRLYVGEYYMPCYITASSKSNYLRSASAADITLTVVPNQCCAWLHETETWFGQSYGLSSAVVGTALVGFAVVGSDGTTDSGSTLDSYPYDYPTGYDAMTSGQGSHVFNDSLAPCGWKIVVKGPAENPAIVIGDDEHKLVYTIDEGETIEIDSRSRTIEAISATGVRTNIFRYRDKTRDIFAQVLPGSHQVSWNGYYVFGITLYSERGEPLWT